MTHGTYGPRVAVHPDRYGAVKTSGPNLWAVLHTSEGGESDTAAENLAVFLSKPGDRPNGRGGMYGSSYHAIFDTDRILPAVPYDVVSYSAGGANAQGIHACFPGKANQTREQWLDPVSRAMIRQCAAWLVDISAEFDIPVHYKMTSGQMRNGESGLGDHYTVTAAFGKTTHTDVGPNFPWDILFSDIAVIVSPLPPPELPVGDPIMFVAAPGPEIAHLTDVHFAIHDSGIVRHASGPDVPKGVEVRLIRGPAHYNIYARAANFMSGAQIQLLPE